MKTKTFEGPGKYLIIPMDRVTNPNCNHVDFPLDKKYKNPPCICVHPILKIPYGWQYVIDPHPEIIGPKVYKKDNYEYKFGWESIK